MPASLLFSTRQVNKVAATWNSSGQGLDDKDVPPAIGMYPPIGLW